MYVKTLLYTLYNKYYIYTVYWSRYLLLYISTTISITIVRYISWYKIYITYIYDTLIFSKENALLSSQRFFDKKLWREMLRILWEIKYYPNYAAHLFVYKHTYIISDLPKKIIHVLKTTPFTFSQSLNCHDDHSIKIGENF